MTTHKGKCFCGAVEIEVQGAPEAMGYCHCASCRSWSAAPVNAFTLWKPQNVRVTKGAEHLGKFTQDRDQPPPVLQALRRPSDDRPSAARPRRRLCRDDPDA